MRLEVGVERLEHHALRRRHRPEDGELVGIERTGIGVGEQADLVQHELGHGREVGDGGVVTVLGQPATSGVVALLGALAEGEQGLVAAGLGPGPGDRQHLIGFEVRRVEPGGWLGEGAIAALVATQHGERDEDLRRVGDPCAERPVADTPGFGHQIIE